MILNDFSASLRFKGSNFKDADVFTWSGTTTTGGSVTSDMGVSQVGAEVTPTDFLTMKTSASPSRVVQVRQVSMAIDPASSKP